MTQCATNYHSLTRVEYWLIEWAKWVKQWRSNIGYPGRSIGIMSGGESRRGADVDQDFEYAAWSVNVKALDSLIEGLPPSQTCAVRHAYLGETWRFPRDNLDQLLELAENELERGCEARGVCI